MNYSVSNWVMVLSLLVFGNGEWGMGNREWGIGNGDENLSVSASPFWTRLACLVINPPFKSPLSRWAKKVIK